MSLRHCDPERGCGLLMVGALVLLLLSLLVLRVSAAGTALYVAPTGNNANGCTLTLPCKTVQYAVGRAVAGDTIYLRGGTYAESVKFARSGTPSQPIILQAYGQEAVTIDGGGSAALTDTSGTMGWLITGLTLRSNANYVLNLDAWGVGTKHWTVRGNTILGAVWIYGSAIVFENNEVDGGGTRPNGVVETQPVSFGNRYLGNNVHDFTIRAFWSMQYTHDSLWQGNKARTIGNLCLDLDGFGQVVYRHSAINNDFADCREAGIELENAFASTVSGNVIVNQDGDGIHVIQYGRTNTPSGLACGTAAGYGDVDGNNNCEGDPSNVVISGNTITITGLGVGIQIYQASDVTVSSNVVRTQYAAALYAYKLSYRNRLSGNTLSGSVGAFEPNGIIYVTDNPTATVTPTSTPMLIASATPTRTNTPLPTATRTASATATATSTPSLTSSPPPSPTATATHTPTATMTGTPLPTDTETATFTPSPTVDFATNTPLPSVTPAPSATPSCALLALDDETVEVCLRKVS